MAKAGQPPKEGVAQRKVSRHDCRRSLTNLNPGAGTREP